MCNQMGNETNKNQQKGAKVAPCYFQSILALLRLKCINEARKQKRPKEAYLGQLLHPRIPEYGTITRLQLDVTPLVCVLPKVELIWDRETQYAIQDWATSISLPALSDVATTMERQKRYSALL